VQYCDNYQNGGGEVNLSQFKPTDGVGIKELTDINIARMSAFQENARHRGEQVIALALLGLRSLVLLNGGAIVSLFTVLGHVSDLSITQARLWGAFVSYAIGLAAVIIAILFGFLSQNEFMLFDYTSAARMYWEITQQVSQEHIDKDVNFGQKNWLTAIGFSVASLALFVIGSGFALSAVQIKPPHAISVHVK
jgi:hypothetical protein